MNKNLIVAIAVILVLGVGGFLVFRGSGQDSTTPGASQTTKSRPVPAEVSGSFTKGQEAPDVSFTDFDGNTHNLSDFAGQAVILDYWADWCPFCRAEMPELQAAQDKYGDDLVMVGVHRTGTESKEVGQRFADKIGITYLLVVDPDDSLYRAAGGFGMPVAVFIDKDGVVTEIKSGPKTKEEIEEKVSRLISSQ
ncbi:redoxin domain-containing protein [Patescibacteria group bacterium]|nr:redoxin domain-containing protein [Patescibacteria group bacterium]